jgi:SAM-dependent methyltransferase
VTYEPLVACRSCGSTGLFPVLDLGLQPLANSYPPAEGKRDEPRYPLAIVGCPDCSLVQLSGTVDPRIMFDEYPYFSSYSTTMVEAMEDLAEHLIKDQNLGENSLVVEIASNDGYLLKHYAARSVPVLGIEPARNVAAVAISAGVPTIAEYFTSELGERLQEDRGGASVLHANNVMAHVPDINDFVAGIAAALRPDGLAVIETPYLRRMVEECEFDTIYHEHVFYYSVTAVERLARRHNLMVTDLEPTPLHGGSLRLFLRPTGTADVSQRVSDWLREEAEVGVDTPDYFRGFTSRVAEIREQTLALLHQEKSAGKRIAAYGAAAKGTVLLNHFGIDRALVEFVVDRSPHKQGRRMPGVAIPILAPEALTARRIDVVLLLAWNFAQEILEQQRAYRDGGGRFLIPIPTPRVL